MKEAIAIAFAMLLWMYAWAMNTSAFDIQSEINNDLRPVAVQINHMQTLTSPSQRKDILSKLTTAKSSTNNYYVVLSLDKLIKKVQSIIDSDIQSSPPASVVTALADTYTY